MIIQSIKYLLDLRKIKEWLLKCAKPYYIEKLQILTTLLIKWGKIHTDVLYIIFVDSPPKKIICLQKTYHYWTDWHIVSRAFCGETM